MLRTCSHILMLRMVCPHTGTFAQLCSCIAAYQHTRLAIRVPMQARILLPVYPCGTQVWMLLSGYPPFHGDEKHMMMKIKAGQASPRALSLSLGSEPLWQVSSFRHHLRGIFLSFISFYIFLYLLFLFLSFSFFFFIYVYMCIYIYIYIYIYFLSLSLYIYIYTFLCIYDFLYF